MQLKLSDNSLTLIDDQDVDLVAGRSWFRTSHGYVASVEKLSPGKYRSIYLHRLITAAPKGAQVDHINRDRADNRRSNLRLCTQQQNRRNTTPKGGTSQYVGVYWSRGKWRAGIWVDNRHIHVGSFESEIEAAIARDKAAENYHGEYAVLNFNTKESNDRET